MDINLVDQDDMAELQEFGRSFEHKVCQSKWPLYTVVDGSITIGYFNVANPVLIYPSVHPHCTPRQVYRAAELVRKRLKVRANQLGCLVPIDSQNFTAEILAKLGFQSTNLSLYIAP